MIAPSWSPPAMSSESREKSRQRTGTSCIISSSLACVHVHGVHVHGVRVHGVHVRMHGVHVRMHGVHPQLVLGLCACVVYTR